MQVAFTRTKKDFRSPLNFLDFFLQDQGCGRMLLQQQPFSKCALSSRYTIMNDSRAQNAPLPFIEEERAGLRWSSNNMMVFVPFEDIEENELEEIEKIFAVAA